MKIVTSGVDELPQDLPIIKTYDKVKAVFPTEGVTATVVVEARRRAREPDRRRHHRAARQAAVASKAFLPGTEVDLQQRRHGRPGRRSRRRAAATTPPSTAALDELRDEIIPATVGRRRRAPRVNVSGDAASSKDYAGPAQRAGCR